MATLEKAFAGGYPQQDAIEKDPDLAALRADPRAEAAHRRALARGGGAPGKPLRAT